MALLQIPISSLGGLYTTSDTVTIEELNENNEVINTINYTFIMQALIIIKIMIENYLG